MASPSGIRAGQAFVELFADDSRLVRGLNAASKRLKAWGQSVTAAGQKMPTAGMAAVGGLLGSAKVFASMGDTMAKASQRTGIGVERLSELAYAAEQSGADLATLEAGVRRMQKAIAEAAGGSESAQETLANLGLSVQQLAGLSPNQQFMLIADRLSRIADPTLRAAAAMAGGAALIVLGGSLSMLWFAFGTLASIVAGVGTALGVIGTVLGAILSPVGLVIAALASLGGYLLYVSGAGQQALSWLDQQFAALRDTALAAWKGISDALAANDIGLAARILWLTLKMEWQKGVAWLTDKWIGFKDAFITVATEAVYGTAKILTSAWAGLQTAWVETVAFISKAWTVFTSSLVTGWRTAQNWIAEKFVQLMAMFDESVDAEGAMRILDEDFAREQRGRDQATQQELRDIETTRQAKRKAIDQEERGKLDALEEERERRHVERRRQYDADLKATEDAVAEARRQWQEALDEAARKRAEISQTAGPERVKAIGDLEGFDFEGLAQRSISVTGTFNPLAAAGLGTGSPLERAVRASEETAKKIRKLVHQAQHGNLVFA